MSRFNSKISSREASFKRCFTVLIIMLVYVLYSFTGIAQVNLVLNPSFEQYSRCPYEADQIQFANPWSPIDTVNHISQKDSFGSGNCTPEYCNTCAPANTDASVPKNTHFYNNPRTGNGMAQVQMFCDETGIPPGFTYLRDYLNGRLYNKLISGKSYCATFYVVLTQQSQYAIDHIGAYLDDGQIDTNKWDNCGLTRTQYAPQIISHNIINDTLHWAKIEGSFIAKGNEQYITIGNFFDQAHTNYTLSVTGAMTGTTWYLVDDVSIVESNTPAYAGRDTTIVAGDSVFIGRNEILPDVKWSLKSRDSGGGWVLIDTLHAGFWVKPAIGTNTYMVQQTLCGTVKYDTVTITVKRVGINGLNGPQNDWHIYPNPAKNEIRVVNVGNTNNAALAIYDLSGRLLL
ncbi:T9SS type A sorting domain-containing protein [Mucilaginibacter paludis]|uniref:Secretion system C-terminal sorting domain-containing protein n=1 Tax=Mucilaginibacter paludis DSM 18603 TaxID=714943 RepID=H1YDX1_9SPHI|nr:T9SS type A sorting domain-containing protein [Mucilaginibacter paludis]EHQ24311.1 hypothetical protein Mucpa_0108 [Mucilaginibacter paludis DSM 18603]